MKPVFSFYTRDDFGRVYQFLKCADADTLLPYDRVRFQFCLGLHIDFTDSETSGGFERTCGLWQDERGIAAMVLTEGGTDGETFFVFRSEGDKTPELLNRMCDFAERFTSKVSEDHKNNYYNLCVTEDDHVVIDFLESRGYTKTTEKEKTLIKTYPETTEQTVLPEGFVIRDAREVEPFYYALVHSHSFRYQQSDDRGKKGFARTRTMPDYRPDLNLIIFDPEGQPAGMANFWISDKSDLAVLEPLGTVWWYQGMGLGKALITEGINRTRKYGCTRMTGGDQPFYYGLDFKVEKEHIYWKWMS